MPRTTLVHMNTYFLILTSIICLGLLAYHVCKPYPMLRILKKNIIESVDEISFTSFLIDCVPEIYQPDATQRGLYSSPLRIYFQARYSFDIRIIESLMQNVFARQRLYFGKSSSVFVKFQTINQDNARCIIEEFKCHTNQKTEYLVLIKRSKVRANTSVPYARSLISISIAYRNKKF